MKLLITLDFPPQRGGIQRYLYDSVSAHYHATDRVVYATNRTNAQPHRAGTTPVIELNSLSNTKFIRIIALTGYLFIHRHHISSIECGNVYAAIAAWLATPFIKRPYRVYTYGTELMGLKGRTIKQTLLKSVLGGAQGLFVLGDYTHSLLTPLKRLPPVTHLPARLHQSYLCKAAEALERYSRPREPFTILSVGRFVSHKGQLIVLDALRRLPPAINWRLQLVGSGPLQKALQDYCTQHNLSRRVTIQSGLEDEQLHQCYAQAHVLVLASLEQGSGTEGFGIVLLEAMAHGLPIIASRCGGIPQVVDNGKFATLVEPGNVEQLAAALIAAASEPTTNRTAAATEHLRSHYVY
jgi:glycosyltransferase involved in cell wall biosynthesis